MTSICIVSPAWGRFDITRLALAQRQRLCVELASRGIEARSLVICDDDNANVALEYGSEPVYAPNHPLGRKCNIGFQKAREYEPDYVVWVGSDDWIHPDVFVPVIGCRIAPNMAMIASGRRLSIVDLATGRLQRLASPGPFGAIPWIIDGRLFNLHPKLHAIDPTLPRGLDGALIRGLRRCSLKFEFNFSDPHDFRCVDFKSRTNLTPFEGLARNIGVGDPEPAWETLAQWYPSDLVEQAERTAAAAAA